MRKKIVNTYDYRDESGILLFQVVRYEPKAFRQRRPDGKGGWIWNLDGVRRVPYRLPELLRSSMQDWVFIVEGEKDVDRLCELGFTATTNPGGACKWLAEYNRFFAGRLVVVLPDNDDAGKKHGEQVVCSLYGTAAQVRLIKLPGLPEKGDVSDWLDIKGNTAAKLLELIDRTEKYTPSAQLGSSDSVDDSIPYYATDRGLYWRRPTRDGETSVQLTNFTAKIVADITYDDGAEQTRTFEVETTLNGMTERFTVPVSRFPAMAWAVEHLGARALVYAGFAQKDHARAAVQSLSTDITTRRIYTHTGWREVEGQWVYLHAGGAIGAAGIVDGIETYLNDNLNRYILPAPPEGKTLQEAIRASLRILGLAPDTVVIPLCCAMWRAVLGPCSFSIHLVGHTGTGKTELEALIQQHFGSEMTARQLPASWTSTGNALEGLAFSAKDTVLVVDDFAPTGTQYDLRQYHQKAERLFRSQGNRSCRQRMRSDATLRPPKPPRCLILSTGEDVPEGQSILARALIIEMGPKDMDWRKLTQCQHDAKTGLYAAALSAFVQWIAGRYKQIQEEMTKNSAEFRQKATQSNQHRRTPEIVGELALGFRYFLDFAESAGAITVAESSDLWARCWDALGKAANSQLVQQAASDSVLRFLELVSSALGSGQAHLAAPDGSKPTGPAAWGWREKTIGTGAGERTEWQPQGHRIGWVTQDDVYLDPDASYKAAQMMAGGGEGISVSGRTLRKRLHERGLIIADDRRETLTVRRVLEGRKHNVLHFSADTFQAHIHGKADIPDISDIDVGFEEANEEPMSVLVSGSSPSSGSNLTSESDTNSHIGPENRDEWQECQECRVLDGDMEPFEFQTPDDLSDNWRDEYEERAAILEYDGGLNREGAEVQARREIFERTEGAKKI